MTKKGEDQIIRLKNSLKAAALLTAINLGLLLMYSGLMQLVNVLNLPMPSDTAYIVLDTVRGVGYFLILAAGLLGYLGGRKIKNDSIMLTIVFTLGIVYGTDIIILGNLKSQGDAFGAALLMTYQIPPLMLSFLGYVIAKVHVKLSNR